MSTNWHRLIPDDSDENAGIIIDAIQRYVQFDTFAGVIPYEEIDTLFTLNELQGLAEQAYTFYKTHHTALFSMPQHMREEAIRAHLCGLIDTPVPSDDLWRADFARIHKKNREVYDALMTPARVELLLERHACSDVIATALSIYYLHTVKEEYTPSGLIKLVAQAKRFYDEHTQQLKRYDQKDQPAVISDFLSGKSDIPW